MPTLDITEASSVASVMSLGASTYLAETHIMSMPPLAEQQVAIGGGSLQSVAFSGTTRFIRVDTDTTCRIAWGKNPTASAANTTRLVAGQTEYFGVNAGDKLAVIQSS
jgi:hypothetical protein